MFTILSAYPDFASMNSNDLSVAQTANATFARQQVAVFSGIPSTAQNCGIQWFYDSTSFPPTNFTVTNSGLTNLIAVKTPLPISMTWNAVQKNLESSIGEADFSRWPQSPAGKDHIISGNIDCATEMAFKVGINGQGAGDVELQQNEKAGLYVKYECT